MRPFLVCIHDATPAYDGETRLMIRDLAPLIGHRLSFGVVPDWLGAWPLTAHSDYCALLKDSSEELLLHGYVHQRRRGSGPTTWLTGGSDEMNGLDRNETQHTLERGQQVFATVFGERSRGFIAPAWQRGHVRLQTDAASGLEHVVGFFSLESRSRHSIRLATSTWHCGRWRWLGHVGHGIGWLLQRMDRGVPHLALHPSDLKLGFWPKILHLTEHLLEAGFEPTTPAALLEGCHAEVVA